MSSYNRWLPPVRDRQGTINVSLAEEANRRENGPICAQCGHSPLTEQDLQPLVPGDSAPVSRVDRTFQCEARGRQCAADSGHGCRHFVRRSRDL